MELERYGKAEPRVCGECRGWGFVSVHTEAGQTHSVSTIPCPGCGGTGEVYDG